MALMQQLVISGQRRGKIVATLSPRLPLVTWAVVVGFPCSEADKFAAYPALTVAVVGEFRIDAGYHLGKNGHVTHWLHQLCDCN